MKKKTRYRLLNVLYEKRDLIFIYALYGRIRGISEVKPQKRAKALSIDMAMKVSTFNITKIPLYQFYFVHNSQIYGYATHSYFSLSGPGNIFPYLWL